MSLEAHATWSVILVTVTMLIQIACCSLTFIAWRRTGHRPFWLLFTAGFLSFGAVRTWVVVQALFFGDPVLREVVDIRNTMPLVQSLVYLGGTLSFFTALILAFLNFRDLSIPSLRTLHEVRELRMVLDKTRKTLDYYTAGRAEKTANGDFP